MTLEEMREEAYNIEYNIKRLTYVYGGIPTDENQKLWEEIDVRIDALVEEVVIDFFRVFDAVKSEDEDRVRCTSEFWAERFMLFEYVGIKDFILPKFAIRLSQSLYNTTTRSYEPKVDLNSEVTSEQIG